MTVPLGQVVPVTNSKMTILSFPLSETNNISFELSIIMFDGFEKSSFPSNESNSNKKSPVESNTDIESDSVLETKMLFDDSWIVIPLAEPRYSSMALFDDPNFDWNSPSSSNIWTLKLSESTTKNFPNASLAMLIGLLNWPSPSTFAPSALSLQFWISAISQNVPYLKS